MKTCVVLPSYNESANIVVLIDTLLEQDPAFFVCIVDDSSPDGTADLLKKVISEKKSWAGRTNLIVRSKKDGRGGAVRDGFEWGYNSNHNFDAFIEMDCDFSHEPTATSIGIQALKEGADAAVGVRYPDGIIINWPFQRRIFSFFANTLARTLMEWEITDYTNGFRFYTKKTVALLLQNPQEHKGYIFLSETLSILLKSGATIFLFPTVFKNRDRGFSNTSIKEILNAFTGIIKISCKYRFDPEASRSNFKVSYNKILL